MIFPFTVAFGWFLVGAIMRPWVRSREQWLLIDLGYCATCFLAGMALYGFGTWHAERPALQLPPHTQAAALVVSGAVALALPGAFLLLRRRWATQPLQFGPLQLTRPPTVEFCLLVGVAFTEELLFRFVLINAFVAHGSNIWRATLMSWGLFCLAHLGWNSVVGVAEVAVVGTVICAAFAVAGLFGSVMVHCLYNTSTTVFRLSKGSDDSIESYRIPR